MRHKGLIGNKLSINTMRCSRKDAHRSLQFRKSDGEHPLHAALEIVNCYSLSKIIFEVFSPFLNDPDIDIFLLHE